MRKGVREIERERVCVCVPLYCVVLGKRDRETMRVREREETDERERA